MSSDSAFAVHIAKDSIAKVVGPLLVDGNVHVRAASASALRYIADNGKAEAHVCLLKDDIMTPLCALLKQVGLTSTGTSVTVGINNLFTVCSITQIGNRNLIELRKVS